MHPLVHVLVINWNGREHLDACFESLLECTYPNARFLLVDNASSDDSVTHVQARFGRDPRVGVVQCPENLGWSGGNNFAMRRSLAGGADYLFLLNNDTATARDAIAHLVDMAEARPGLAAIAPKILLFDAPDLLNSLGLYCSRAGASWDIGIGRLDGPQWDTPQAVIGVCGAAMFLRANAVQASGLFPDEFEIYFDDLDLCLRLWDAGHAIQTCPGAMVRHKFSATWGEGARARRKYYLNTRNRFWLMLRNFPLRTLPQYLPYLLLGECRALGRATLDGEFWRVGAHARAWVAALLYTPKARAARHGRTMGRFWPLIHRERMFSAGVEIPQDGWYAARSFEGRNVRPISRRAAHESPGGALRVFHANCYPRLGATDIAVMQNGCCLAVLSTLDCEETVIETRAGTLIFEARHIFDAGETGERADYGGWLDVSQGNR